MSHLDEGILSELIDHELSDVDQRKAEVHLAECGECRRLLEELKGFAAEADGLVASVEVPARTAARVPPAPPTAAEPHRWGMPRWRTYAWAASVVLAVGLGWAASDLRYPAPAEMGRLGEEKERMESVPAVSDAPSTPARESPPAPASTSTNSTRPVHVPRDRAGGTPAELGDEKAASAAVLAEQAVRSDTDRGNTPNRPSSQPQAVAKLAQDAAREMDSVAVGSFGNASVAASPPAAAAPEQGFREGRMARRAVSGFRQVEMQEAVRVLGGSIRLIEGFEARRILLGPGPQAAATDPASDLVRIVYEDPPGRELWLDQQRPEALEQRLGAGYVPIPGDTITTRDGSGPVRLRWMDERGFRLALTGYLATDSLRALIHRVH